MLHSSMFDTKLQPCSLADVCSLQIHVYNAFLLSLMQKFAIMDEALNPSTVASKCLTSGNKLALLLGQADHCMLDKDLHKKISSAFSCIFL